jgi:hypothetical protein
MKQKSWFKYGFPFLLLLFVFSIWKLDTLSADTSLKVGDTVFAEWAHNSWYHGKISKTCEKGWYINFDDGDVKCCSGSEVVMDVVSEATQLTQGKRVLAQWTNGKYYPGTISSVAGEDYNIQFDDGDKGAVKASQIRIINAGPMQTPMK